MGLTRRLKETETLLLKSMHMLAYSQSQHKDSKLKTAWGSSWLARTAPVYPQACTRHPLLPILLQCCSPLEQGLPLPMTMHTLRGSGASLDMTLSLIRVKVAIARTHVPTYI